MHKHTVRISLADITSYTRIDFQRVERKTVRGKNGGSYFAKHGHGVGARPAMDPIVCQFNHVFAQIVSARCIHTMLRRRCGMSVRHCRPSTRQQRYASLDTTADSMKSSAINFLHPFIEHRGPPEHNAQASTST